MPDRMARFISESSTSRIFFLLSTLVLAPYRRSRSELFPTGVPCRLFAAKKKPVLSLIRPARALRRLPPPSRAAALPFLCGPPDFLTKLEHPVPLTSIDFTVLHYRQNCKTNFRQFPPSSPRFVQKSPFFPGPSPLSHLIQSPVPHFEKFGAILCRILRNLIAFLRHKAYSKIE